MPFHWDTLTSQLVLAKYLFFFLKNLLRYFPMQTIPTIWRVKSQECLSSELILFNLWSLTPFGNEIKNITESIIPFQKECENKGSCWQANQITREASVRERVVSVQWSSFIALAFWWWQNQLSRLFCPSLSTINFHAGSEQKLAFQWP